jgi:DNA-binding CsgD family transcriptional regulator/tetratricopeptide (TPR) repeat protein
MPVMELWERSAALSALDGLLADSAHGGRIAVVAGEAGIGKTALVAAFAQRHRTSARFLWGACDRLVTPRALGPLHDIGRQAGGALAARLAAGASREEVLDALLAELAGPRQRPRPVVVVEDAHWADEATLDLLVLLGRRIARVPALLVLTHRDDELGPDHPLRGALAALPHPVVRRMAVPPLSPDCVAEQARRAGRDPDAVHRLAGGNPLLVTELLATAPSDGAAAPATARDLILDRLRTLPEPARDLAHLVAVVPTRADAAVVTGAADLVDACVAAGVLVPADDGVAYRHELLRAAVEDSLSPVRRAALHRRVLAALRARGGVDPARLVHHARAAGDGDAVLAYGPVAGAGAAAQGAHREAAAHYRAAAAHADRLPAAQRADLLEEYAVQAYLAGRSEEGLEARSRALVLREELGQAERVGENLRWISRLAWWSGHTAQAREAGERAVAVLGTVPPGRQLAMAYSNLSQLHMLAEEIDEAVAWGARARALADRLGDVETSVHAAVNVHTARLHTGDPAALDGLLAEHRRAAAAGLVDHAARALVNRASALTDLRDHARAADAVEHALAYATEQDVDGYVQYLHGVRAEIRFARGEWDAALSDVDEALTRPVRVGVAVVPALVTRARIQAARGDEAAGSTLDEAAAQVDADGEVQWVGRVAAARAEHLRLRGDAAGATEAARHGLRLALRSGHPWHIGELAYRLWRAGGLDAAPAGAADPYRKMVEGDWAGAAADWARLGNAHARVEALAAGDRAAAAEALRWLDDRGAVRAARRLRAELRHRGVTGVPRGPRPATAAGVAGLTPRQTDVLALLAEGLSNAEIAERLSLSAKTVDHHVSAVLAKLGVTSRGQAAAAARRLLPDRPR